MARARLRRSRRGHGQAALPDPHRPRHEARSGEGLRHARRGGFQREVHHQGVRNAGRAAAGLAGPPRAERLAVYLRLAAVTGARRGELCALKWSDVDLADGEVLIARSLALGTHEVVEKQTKTYRSRRIALDPGTVKALEEQRTRMENRAEICEAELVADAYVFARDVAGRVPWRPDSGATGRFLRLRKKAGLDTVRLHDLRH